MADPQAQLKCLQDVWDTCQANDDQKHVLIKVSKLSVEDHPVTYFQSRIYLHM